MLGAKHCIYECTNGLMVQDVHHCGILGSGQGRQHNREFCAGVHWGGDGFQVLKPKLMDD